MSIEIRELHIKAVVGTSAAQESSGSGAGEEDRESLVAQCVDRVLEVLSRQKER